MNFLNLFKIAVKALNRNKLRAILTMLGIIIGIAAVICMLAIGQGSKDSIKAQISEMGSNMIMIHPGNMQRGLWWATTTGRRVSTVSRPNTWTYANSPWRTARCLRNPT